MPRPGDLSPIALAFLLASAGCGSPGGGAATGGASAQGSAGDTSSRMVRSASAATPSGERSGGVHIARLLPDPDAVADELGEWVELRNTTGAALPVGGWRLRSNADPGLTIPTGVVVPAQGALRLVRSADPARNGGHRGVLALTGITLGNRSDWVALSDAGGRTADSVAWSDTRPGVEIEHAAPDVPQQPSTMPPPSGPTSDPAARAPLTVDVLDVGQGDAVLIRNGPSIALVDGGPDADQLGRHLDRLGIGRDTTIDLVVASHAHADHYLGLQELFRSRRNLNVRFFFENQDASPNSTLRRLRDSVGARVRRGRLVYRDGDDPCADGRPVCTITMRGGARLHFLRPDPAADHPNDRSLLVKVVGPDSASFTMWLAGDAEERGIAWLERAGYARAPGMDVDVLKANHHGSCNGVTPRYLQLTAPALLVASLAAQNDYGHMHEQAKAAYRAARVPWYRTDQNGTITIRSPGTRGGGYTVAVERGERSMSGPVDRKARCE